MGLTGTTSWYNELGSYMEITVDGNLVTGIYQTAVGDAEGIYELVGRVETAGYASQVIGFVVMWENEHGNSEAITTWCGEWQIIDGEPVIVTTWLLTHQTDVEDDWKSTSVNKDYFTQIPPSEDDVQRNIQRGVKASHPKR